MKIYERGNALLTTSFFLLPYLGSCYPGNYLDQNSSLIPRGDTAPGPPWIPLGSGTGVGSILPMASYEAKGAQKMRDYETAIASNRADTKAVTDLCEVDVGPLPIAFADIFSSQIDPKPYYIPSTIGVSVNKYPELNLFKQADTGVDLIGKKFPEYDIRNDDKASSLTINQGGYDNGGTFIVANIAFKDADKKAKDDPSRVPNNDMTWQVFAKAATKKNVKNLKVIYLRDVQNAGMWAITQKNYSERKIDLSTIEGCVDAAGGDLVQPLLGQRQCQREDTDVDEPPSSPGE